MILFHVSIDLNHNGKFIPRVPDLIEEGDGEDCITPRICFSDSIEGCLSSMPDGGRGLKDFCNSRNKGILKLFSLDLDMYTGRVLFPEDIKDKVPDALFHREYWLLDPVDLGEGQLIQIVDFKVDNNTDRVYDLKLKKLKSTNKMSYF